MSDLKESENNHCRTYEAIDSSNGGYNCQDTRFAVPETSCIIPIYYTNRHTTNGTHRNVRFDV